jgi:hypothetical protein
VEAKAGQRHSWECKKTWKLETTTRGSSPSCQSPDKTKEGGLMTFSKAIIWNSDSHDQTIMHMTRALYFRQFDEILSRSINIQILVVRKFSQLINDTFQDTPILDIGRGQFICRYLKDESQPFLSLWLYEFHGKHRVIASTNITADFIEGSQ